MFQDLKKLLKSTAGPASRSPEIFFGVCKFVLHFSEGLHARFVQSCAVDQRTRAQRMGTDIFEGFAFFIAMRTLLCRYPPIVPQGVSVFFIGLWPAWVLVTAPMCAGLVLVSDQQGARSIKRAKARHNDIFFWRLAKRPVGF